MIPSPNNRKDTMTRSIFIYRNHYKVMILSLLILWPALLQAQQPGGRYMSFDDFLESLLEESDETEVYASLVEELQELNQHPVNVNTAKLEELLKIPFLNELSASHILEYRRKHGTIYSVYELASVTGIGRDLAEKISFFITTEIINPEETKDTLYKKAGIHQILLRSYATFPLSAGYRGEGEKPPAYTGSPPAAYARYSFEKSGILQAGITADKDPGEQFFRGTSRYGFDFYSGHISFGLNRFITRITLGDYTIRTGQGLVCWQGFSLGKSSDVMQASRNMSNIKPYTSTDENKFFRGAAVSFTYKNLGIQYFISSKKSDGNLFTSEDGSRYFSSLQTSGYHRTVSEAEDKKSIRHTVTGSIISLLTNQMRIGFTALYEKYQYPFSPGDQLYEKFYLRGRDNFNIGTDYHWINGKFHFFGEAAFSKSGGFAVTNGMEVRLHDQLSATFLYRHFDKNYQATWANAFAAEDKANNETGWYAGIRLLPVSGIGISAYTDGFYWPWIKYTTAAPVRGFDYSLKCDIRLNRRLTGYIRYKNRSRIDKSTDGNLYVNRVEQSANLRFHTKYDINSQYSLGWRLEWSRTENPQSETGFLCFQDFAWTCRKFPVSTVFRASWFHTSSYNSKIFAYENDLLYAFSTIAFFGKGFRAYVKIKYEWTDNLEIWWKMAGSWYPGQEKISSGSGEIAGNMKREIKFQIRYRF
jgi:hypothetical protein